MALFIARLLFLRAPLLLLLLLLFVYRVCRKIGSEQTKCRLLYSWRFISDTYPPSRLKLWETVQHDRQYASANVITAVFYDALVFHHLRQRIRSTDLFSLLAQYSTYSAVSGPCISSRVVWLSCAAGRIEKTVDSALVFILDLIY